MTRAGANSFEAAWRANGRASHGSENGRRNAPGWEASPGVLLSEVEAETVEWLWPGRIPLGKITLIEGDPDNGKSAAAEALITMFWLKSGRY